MVTKIFSSVLLLFLLNNNIQGQNYYSPYLRISTASTKSGNSAQIGAGVDANITIGRFKLDLDGSIVSESKVYVGNGKSYRAQGEFGGKLVNSVWVLAGISSARHVNSSYTKLQHQPLMSVHYTPNKSTDIYYTKLFKAYGNANYVQGNRFGYRAYITGLSFKMPLFIQCELNSITFLDSSLNKRSDKYAVFGVGVSFKH